MVRGSPVRFPAGLLWSFLGQDSSLHIATVHPAVNRGPGTKGIMVM